MAFKRVAVVLSLGCVLFVISEPFSVAETKKKAAKSDPALPKVENVLRSEVAGQVDRRGQLTETLKEQPGSTFARWQAGFVKDGDSWRSFDEPLRDSTLTGLLADYRRRREEAPRAFDGQMDLANWCRKRQLFDRERAHLIAALNLAPDRDNTDILLRLGCRQIGGFWFGREDLTEWRRLNQQAETALKRYESQLSSIARGLSGSSRQRDAAVARLRQMNDPSAIPAIELTLSGQSQEAALAAVNLFERMNGPEA